MQTNHTPNNNMNSHNNNINIDSSIVIRSIIIIINDNTDKYIKHVRPTGSARLH